jgi:hypothetical protein
MGKPSKGITKVYGWSGFRSECPPRPNGSRQTREIVAGRSKFAIRESFGSTNKPIASEICETGNDVELALSTAEVGRVFWQPLGARKDEPWTRAEFIPNIKQTNVKAK